MNRLSCRYLAGIALLAFNLTVFSADNINDIKLRDINGKPVSLKLLAQNGPVIVDFWATWCVPCHAEMKEIDKIEKKYRDQGLSVLAVSVDGAGQVAQVRQFIKTRKYNFTVAMDTDKTLSTRFKATAAPTVIIIAQGGAVHSLHLGYTAGDEKKLEAEIVSLLVKKTETGSSDILENTEK